MNETKTLKKGSYTVAKAFIELGTNLSNVFLLALPRSNKKLAFKDQLLTGLT